MKEFKLKKISYQNIMSVGSTPIVIQLDKCHKTLITGFNGAGKSTMLEAITFALFGRPFRDIKKGQLINSVNKKGLLVELNMEYDGHLYEITRGQKPNIFKVIKDGISLDENASSKDFQSDFEQMIGMNYNSYKQVVVLGTAGYTPFMGLKTPERRKLVEDLLEVSVIAEMDKLNKSIIKDLKVDVSKMDLEISHIQTQIKAEEEFAEKQKRMSGDNIARLQSMFDGEVSKIQELKTKNVELANQIVEIVLPENPTEQMNLHHQKRIQLMTNQQTFVSVSNLYEKGGKCPSCLQELSNQSLKSKIDDKRNELQLLIDDESKIIEELRPKITDWTTKNAELVSLKNEIESNKKLAIGYAERAKKIKETIAEAQKEFVNNDDKISTLKQTLNEKIQLKSDVLVEIHRRGYILDMLKDGGIKGAIIQKYIPLFNKQINHYLSVMEADYSFTLNEEFNETIKSRGREDFSYASFSQGEKARIDLALLFTWRNVAEKISGIKISCLFLDEVADGSTDAQGVKTIQQILNDLKDTNTFIISHRDHNPEDYGQHLQMKKVGRFTILEEE